MVYKNRIVHDNAKWDPEYANEHFRALQGYKELEVPNPPQRRNRDFKTLNNGDLIGYPKGRQSVPYQQYRNFRDLFEEHDMFAIKYLKTFIKGMVVGCVFTIPHITQVAF